MDMDIQLKAVEAQVLETHKDLKSWIEKSNEEIKTAGSVAAETKNAIDKVAEKANDLADRMMAMEQKAAAHYEGEPEVKSVGNMLIEADEFKHIQSRKSGSCRIEIKTAIVNATPSMVQPLVAGHRLDGIVTAPNRPLRIRDVLRVSRTSSNIVWFAKENVFTNSAAVVTGGSPIVASGAAAENVTKPESAITFTSDSVNVVTIAHFIPISKQVMEDSAQLASHVDGRLLYGLKLVEEEELVNGTNPGIKGLWDSKTAYAQAQSPNEYGTSRIDQLGDAQRQAEAANYTPSFYLLNPQDWWTLCLAKDSENRYLIGNPQGVIPRTLWGLPVVTSNTMTAGNFLLVDNTSCEIWDREDANVQVSYEDSVNFQKNMITVRAEERLAFAVYRAGGIIGGTLPAAGS